MHAVEEFLRHGEGMEQLRAALQGPYDPVTLRCAKIKITAKCNLKCGFCDYWRMHEPDELSTAEWRTVLDSLKAEGCVKVHFSGGEATLRQDLHELLAYTTQLGMKANFTTNGTTMTSDRAAAVVNTGAHGVSLSLDGPDDSTHDRIRGVPGSFSRTVKGIRRLSRARDRARGKLRIRINTVLTRHNYRRLPEVIDLASELGATDVLPMPVDERGATPEHRLSKSDISYFNSFVLPLAEEARRRAGFSVSEPLLAPFGRSERDQEFSSHGRYARGHFREHVCYVPWMHAFIGWSGDVYLCCMARGKTEPLGNVRRSSIGEVFRGDAYRAIRAQFLTEMPKVCHRCDMFQAENERVDTLLGADAPRPERSGPGVELRSAETLARKPNLRLLPLLPERR